MSTSAEEEEPGIQGTRSAIAYSLSLLEPRDRRRYRQVVAAQMLTSLLDLLGVLLIGLVGVLAGYTASGEELPSTVTQALDRMGLEALPIEQVTLILAGLAVALLLTKSLVSAVLLRRAYRILADAQVAASKRVTERLLAVPFFAFQKGTSHEFTWLLGVGLNLTICGLLGGLAVLLSEATLLVVLVVALAVAAPATTLAAILYFAVLAIGLHRLVGKWSHRTEERIATSYVNGQRSVQEALQLLPEIIVGNRRSLYEERINENLRQNALAMADQNYISQLPKLAYESALVIGLIMMAAWQLATDDLATLIRVLAVFLAAGARLMPALIRLQNSAVAVRARSANAERVNAALGSLPHPDPTQRGGRLDVERFEQGVRSGHQGFNPEVRIEGVSLTYPGSESPALRDISLNVEPGGVVALAGPTGAGKSSLLGVMLGLYSPDCGQILLGGQVVGDSVNRWPGAVAYVPQHIALVHGTVRDNVALGLPSELVDDARIWEMLELASLSAFLRESRRGLDTPIGEHGSHLSGGQRQRLGLARALYSRPRLLILDEATSALDGETEAAVTAALLTLRGEMTIVAVAHRVATLEMADSVVYVRGGEVDFVGSYQELKLANLDMSLDLRRAKASADQNVGTSSFLP